MNINIIQAGPAHAATIAGIGRTSFFDTFCAIFTNRQELQNYLDHTFSIDKISRSLQNPGNLYSLAMCNGEPAGFVKLKKHSRHKALDAGNQVELQKIYVLQPFLGNGTGKMLIETAIRQAQELQPDYLWLDVHVTNDRALRFYEKTGFFKVGAHQFTIGSQTFDFDVMALPLKTT